MYNLGQLQIHEWQQQQTAIIRKEKREKKMGKTFKWTTDHSIQLDEYFVQ